MRILYLDCPMGVAGDMLMAALLELTKEPNVSLDRLNEIGFPKVNIQSQKTQKCGITGTHIEVSISGEVEGHGHQHHHHEHEHREHEHHHHSKLGDINHIIGHLKVSDKVKSDALEVYKLIAEAESKAHDMPVDMIHFHEVGQMDAVADIVSVCALLEELAPDKIIASPVCTGFGKVHCAHGILPVPAPATAGILKGIPSYAGDIEGELTTPTGAALIKHFANEFSQMPAMITEGIGYGMGSKDFAMANCVRAFLGEIGSSRDEVIELSANIDDMTAEDIGFATLALMETKALDVYTTSIGMKKNRPGTMITVLCRAEDKDDIVKVFFETTTTIGIREKLFIRHVLKREEVEIDTPLGAIRKKVSKGYGVVKEKLEYDDLMEIAKNKRC